MPETLKILHVNDHEIGGGAANVARDLHNACLENGLNSILAVGSKKTEDPLVKAIPKPDTAWLRINRALQVRLASRQESVKGLWRVVKLLKKWELPQRAVENFLGLENFYAPGSGHLLSLPPWRPHIIHCHNLHGRYFDLRCLPALSRDIPLILTMHDPWLLNGHCVHPFDCERWLIGCGKCPYLKTFPQLSRDGTKYNWKRKKRIYEKSRLFVACDCEWVHSNMRRSMLGGAAEGSKTIYLGVKTDCFKPGNRAALRKELGLPVQSDILLFAANTIRENQWKDFRTMRAALDIAGASGIQRPLLFIALGDEAPPIPCGMAEIRFVPYQRNSGVVARYFQAADIYLHAARADTFPLAIMESLACGTPVLATAVGGIPEQVKGCREILGSGSDGLNKYPEEEATGLLVPPGNPDFLSRGILGLLRQTSIRKTLGINARRDAETRFDFRRECAEYLDLYRELACL